MDLRAPLASCFLVAALLAAPPLSSTAHAQGQGQAQGLSAQDEANARFQTGLKYYDNRDFESARLAFKQAYAVLQKPSILLNLALSELYSNHPLDSIAHFEEYMRDPSTPPDKRESTRKHLDEAMKKTAHLQIRTSADAQLTIDARPVPPPYAMVHVMPGAHSVEARVGSKTKSANINPKAGDTVPLDLTIEGEPVAPVEPPPATNPSSPSSSANPNPPVTEPPPVAPTDSPSPARWIVPIGLGVAALGSAAVGVIFASANKSSLDDAESLRRAGPSNICADRSSAPCQAYESKLDDASSQGTISTIGYAASGVFLVGAIATLVFWPRSNKSSASTFIVAPIIAQSPGAFASVTF